MDDNLKLDRLPAMNIQPALAVSVRPRNRLNTRTFDVLCILGGSVLIAVLAQVRIDLGFTPVPITGQTLGVLLVGALLGSKRGSAAVIAYLLEGAAGLPVFAGGMTGAAYMAGPTGGYLLGFIATAFVVGLLAERGWCRRIDTAALALAFGLSLTLLCGWVWLSILLGPRPAIAAGVLPFLPGGGFKIALACLLLPAGDRLLRTLRPDQSDDDGSS